MTPAQDKSAILHLTERTWARSDRHEIASHYISSVLSCTAVIITKSSNIHKSRLVKVFIALHVAGVVHAASTGCNQRVFTNLEGFGSCANNETIQHHTKSRIGNKGPVYTLRRQLCAYVIVPWNTAWMSLSCYSAVAEIVFSIWPIGWRHKVGQEFGTSAAR